MAIYLNRYYALVPYSGNSTLSLSVSSSTITNPTNVVVKTFDQNNPSDSQKWIVKKTSGKQKLFNKRSSEMHALNIYLGSDNLNNCNIYYSNSPDNNNEDSEITFSTIDEDNMIYGIKMKSHNLYLTVDKAIDGGNVLWKSYTASDSQKWKFIPYAVPQLGSPIETYTYISRGFNSAISHYGIDYAAPEGNTIKAAANGTVLFVNNYLLAGNPNYTDHWYDFGNALFIEHESGMAIYMHMLELPEFNVGDTVAKGQAIGKVGNTGNSNGNHLHFEFHTGTDFTSNTAEAYLEGTKVNPQLYM